MYTQISNTYCTQQGNTELKREQVTCTQISNTYCTQQGNTELKREQVTQDKHNIHNTYTCINYFIEW